MLYSTTNIHQPLKPNIIDKTMPMNSNGEEKIIHEELKCAQEALNVVRSWPTFRDWGRFAAQMLLPHYHLVSLISSLSSELLLIILFLIISNPSRE